MDIATAANFPCQRPFSQRLGVAELPQYRILPNVKQVVISSNQWLAARGRWAVPLHPGAADHRDRADLSTGRLVSRLGFDRALHPRGPAAQAPGRHHRERFDARVGWTRTDRSGLCHDRRADRDDAGAPPSVRDLAVLRWIAMIAGARSGRPGHRDPLLPVVQTTATLNWPQGGQLSNVTAPLISQAPVSMDVTVPLRG